MTKKIKSFNVDEEVYTRLISIFKEYKTKTSISMFLNNKLKDLLHFMEQIEEGIKETNYSFPMSFVIDEAVNGRIELRHLSFEPDPEGDPITEIQEVLMYLEDCYRADQEGIPREFYEHCRLGYVLSRDKKFLIDEEGRKFIVRGGKLKQVIEVDSKDITEKKRK